MPGIQATLANYDLDFINRAARFWNAEISQHDVSSARSDLFRFMKDRANLQSVLQTLPEPVLKAWEELLAKRGRIPWAVFSRNYGEIRDFGPARREREKPDQKPASVSETLWYSGLIGKAFLKVSGELIEMVYIPDEIFHLASPAKEEEKPSVRPAVNQNPRYVKSADSSILDHLTDLLAAMRMSRPLPSAAFSAWNIPPAFLLSILASAGLTDETRQPIPEALKMFFQQSRAASLLMLYQVWLKAAELNELRMLPGLIFEGAWTNDPLSPRRLLLEILSSLQTQTWWSISSIISLIKSKNADFQRPAGDYDSWFIRKEGTDQYLRGFEHWDEVDGQLIYFLLTGPLHWWGLVNLARGEAEGKFTAIQLNPTALPMMQREMPTQAAEEDCTPEFKENAVIVIPLHTSRELRYQIGRFCEFSGTSGSESRYRLTPSALEAASSQGLHIHQLIQLLERNSTRSIPASFKRLSQRWEEFGLEAAIQTGVLLKFSTDEACAKFQQEPRSERLIKEVLNSTTLLIHSQSREAVHRLLADMGILAQEEADV